MVTLSFDGYRLLFWRIVLLGCLPQLALTAALVRIAPRRLAIAGAVLVATSWFFVAGMGLRVFFGLRLITPA